MKYTENMFKSYYVCFYYNCAILQHNNLTTTYIINIPGTKLPYSLQYNKSQNYSKNKCYKSRNTRQTDHSHDPKQK